MKKLWQYRYFIISSIKTDFSTRFARSKLGGLWLLISPLAQVLMYALVLSYALRAKLPGVDSQFAYAIYLISGMMAWALFSDTVLSCMNCFVKNANILKKLAFPRMCLPIIATGSSVFTNVVLVVVSIVIAFFCGANIGFNLIYIPLLATLLLALGFGAGLLCGVVNVFLRDLGHFIGILLQFGFWFTPIVYMINLIPPQYQHLMYFNPLACVIEGYHNVILYNKAPDFSLLIYPSILAFLLIVLGLFVYKRAKNDMADVL